MTTAGEDEVVGADSGFFVSTSLREFRILTASSIVFKAPKLPSVSPRSLLTPQSSRIFVIVFFNSSLSVSAFTAAASASAISTGGFWKNAGIYENSEQET
ncbi:hypothetical protein F2Q68_00022470 [Brassica cretica]|uniref:Uncharacterized protein n=1 Tax=Brassica cretica TaxID=69181 RepID=A0A8S9G0Q1_BRACR|nr:hypothetical protein F2Q68_00022470 [Brassica cretica]